MNSKDAGNYLREARKSKKISLRKMGADVGINFTYLSGLENGRGSVLNWPSGDTLLRICSYLEVDPIPVLCGAGKIPSVISDLLMRPDVMSTMLALANDFESYKGRYPECASILLDHFNSPEEVECGDHVLVDSFLDICDGYTGYVRGIDDDSSMAVIDIPGYGDEVPFSKDVLVKLPEDVVCRSWNVGNVYGNENKTDG